MIERDFDTGLIANLALREKQVQQIYRPYIAVHKWFARRPGTLFRGLLLSEFARAPLSEAYYASHSFPGLCIADPFMGGGTPVIEANRIGCEVHGFDINPMAWWIVKQEVEYLDLKAYSQAAAKLRSDLEGRIGHLYRTTCLECGSTAAQIKYCLWVKVQTCRECGKDISLFPGYLVAENRRHPLNVFLCPGCGELCEAANRQVPGDCQHCGTALSEAGPASRSRCLCPHCRAVNTYPIPQHGPPRHRMYAMEYHCPECRDTHRGRLFKAPSPEDFARYAEAEARLSKLALAWVPEETIPQGDETNRLHRWGYSHYREMFNARQLLGLELSGELIASQPNERVRNALATNLSDLLRYQNMLCRYDRMALKSLDVFSVHGFPVGLLQCESNLLGIADPGRRTGVGSGGWANVIDKFTKGKAYCVRPFEFRHEGSRQTQVEVPGEWIGDRRNGNWQPGDRLVSLNCEDATGATFAPGSLDGVFTDPPYFGNVQYAELMDFCYVWLRRLLGKEMTPFHAASTRHRNELTGNENMGRGLEHFTEGMSAVFRRMARALKPGAPLAFTYHHNRVDAYYPIAVSILDSGLTCSGSLPCPAEMGASIHISGTASSTVDTVFVCRSTGRMPRKWLADSVEGVAQIVRHDLANLSSASRYHPTAGDVRCIVFGHVIRLAIWHLRQSWNTDRPTADRLASVAAWIATELDPDRIAAVVMGASRSPTESMPLWTGELPTPYESESDEISF